MLPIAIKEVTWWEDPGRICLRGQIILVFCSSIDYIFLAGWFILSVVTGKFLYRISYNLLVIFMAIILLSSLLRIKGIMGSGVPLASSDQD